MAALSMQRDTDWCALGGNSLRLCVLTGVLAGEELKAARSGVLVGKDESSQYCVECVGEFIHKLQPCMVGSF